MKVLLFASEIKGVNYLKSIFKELKLQNFTTSFIYSITDHILNLPLESDKLCYDTNTDSQDNFIYLESLGVATQFIPDYLIITRDRWMPELGLIYEFKSKYPNTKICYIEVNSHLIQAIEIKLEYISRTSFPQNQIDIFFDHSKFCLDNKKVSLNWEGWNRGVIVGNPYWDLHSDSQNQINKCISKYNIDPNKTQILFFGLVNGFRYEAFKHLKYILANINKDKYQVFLKPFPGERNHPSFSKDHNPKFFIEGLDGIVYDQDDLISMSYICDYHITSLSSVNYGGVLFNKQIVTLNSIMDVDKLHNNLDFFLKDNHTSDSYNSSFWMRVHKLSTKQDFIDMVNPKDLKKFEEKNYLLNQVISKYTHIFDSTLNFLESPKKDTLKLLPYFDEFGDRKSSERIVNHLKSLDI